MAFHKEASSASLPPAEKGVIVDADHLVELLGRDVRNAGRHRSQSRLENEFALSASAMAARGIPIARESNVGVHGTYHAIALQLCSIASWYWIPPLP